MNFPTRLFDGYCIPSNSNLYENWGISLVVVQLTRKLMAKQMSN